MTDKTQAADYLQNTITNYLDYCQYQKRLDAKTLKAYRIDLNQALERLFCQLPVSHFSDITPVMLETYISSLHKFYQPKTVKRKIASLKAFFHYLEYRDILSFVP